MLFKKKGYPQEGECVFCTVTKIQYHSVFVNLDEYEHKSGMVHISEISPGRIRNIRDYVKEGKVIICKVLRINKDRGHIDLSLRRVNENQRRAKVEERKQQVIAENILQSYATVNKLEVKDVYKEVSSALLKEYETLYSAFEDVVENEVDLSTKGLDKKLADDLIPFIKERIKPKEVAIEAKLKLSSYSEDGVDKINKLNEKILNTDEKTSLQFLGSGSFKLRVTAREYKTAEEVMDKIDTILENASEKESIEYSLERE
ncbi:MAG: translation initiation factor IF-2 subunit alpha [Candidatus Woesearchaeota archaeon]